MTHADSRGGEPYGTRVAPKPAMKALRLRIVHHPDPPRVFHFNEFPVSVGRSGACDCSLKVSYISRLHMRFDSRDGRLVVRDEGGRIGTWTASGPRRLPPFQWVDLPGGQRGAVRGFRSLRGRDRRDREDLDAGALTEPELEIPVFQSGEFPAAAPARR